MRNSATSSAESSSGARLRASAAELLAAGLRDFSFFCRDLPSSPIAPDPKDSYLLALAEASEAEFLVTGDKELLSLKRHKSTRIINPAAMIELLKEAEERRATKDKGSDERSHDADLAS